MRSLIAHFVERPLLVRLMMVFILVAALLALDRIQFQTMPEIDFGILNVTTARPGSSPEDIELAITIPLEEEILKVSGIQTVVSNSMEGLSVITLRISPDASNPTAVESAVRRAVDRAVPRLPDDLQLKPQVEEVSTLETPLMEVHVTGLVSEETLRRTARRLRDELREVRSVADVELRGYRDREVRILLDPERLYRLNVTHAEIIDAVAKRNVRDAGGSIESFVAERKVVTIGKFEYPQEVENVVVRSVGPGNDIRISDLAEVVLDYEDWDIQSRLDGQISILLLPKKAAGSDALDATNEVYNVLDKVRPQLDAGVRIEVVNDWSRFVFDFINTLTNNALLGLVCVFGVLLMFFHLRMALWVCVGLPVSLFIALASMPFLGLSLDYLTIMAIILMIGMLVDDAIVTGESIYTQKENGTEPIKASIEGANMVLRPVAVASITTVLALAPLAALGGIEGKFIWTLPVMVALMLTGSLIECFLMLPGHLVHGHPSGVTKQWFATVTSSFREALATILHRRYAAIGLFVLGLVASVVCWVLWIPFHMYPPMDIDIINVKVELPEGSSFERTVGRAQEIERFIRELIPEKELLDITSQIGHHDTDIYGVTDGANPAWALLAIYLQPQGTRQKDSNVLIEELRKGAIALGGPGSILIEAFSDAPVVGTPLQLEIIGDDNSRFGAAKELREYVSGIAGVTSVESSYQPGKDVLELNLDDDALSSRGLTVSDVTTAVRIALDGLIIDELQTVEERIRYRLQFVSGPHGKLDMLKNLVIINSSGDRISLNGVAKFELRPGEAKIHHYSGIRTTTLAGSIDRGLISAGALNRKIAVYAEEHGLLNRFENIRLVYGGESEQESEAIENLGSAFLFCTIGVALCLIGLFGSVTQPFLILSAIPFSVSGVIIAFGVQGLPLSFMALVGLLGLIGVLVNDTIVLIHRLNERLRALPDQRKFLRDDEIVDGVTERLRPIFITSVTTAAGLFPAAYGLAGYNPFIAPMIIAMFWGVIFDVAVTLLLVPCFFAVEQDLRRKTEVLWSRVRDRVPLPATAVAASRSHAPD